MMKRNAPHLSELHGTRRAVLDWLIDFWLENDEAGQECARLAGSKEEARTALYDLIYVGAVVIQTGDIQPDGDFSLWIGFNPKIATSRKVRREIEARVARMNSGVGRTWASLAGGAAP
jgi:hypothetical protein